MRELGDVTGEVMKGGNEQQTSMMDDCQRIRATPLNWDVTAQADLLTEAQLAAFKQYDAPSAPKSDLIRELGDEIMGAMAALLHKVASNESLKHVLVLLDDVLADKANSHLARRTQQSTTPSLSNVLARLVNRDSEMLLSHLAARTLARLMGTDDQLVPADDRNILWQFARRELQDVDTDRQVVCLKHLFLALRHESTRLEAAEKLDMLDCVRSVLSVDSSIQLQYQTILVLWVATFNSPVVELLGDHAQRMIGAVAPVLVNAKKEKLVRVCVALLANLTSKAVSSDVATRNAMTIISCKLMPVVSSINTQKPYEDEELQADADQLANRLADVFDHMSSFDEYDTELKSGKLEWNPVHNSERFWKENVMRLNDNKHELLKILVQYIKTPPDSETLSVAVHDVGEYVRHYPFGKRALEDLQAKEAIMSHMQHPDSKVRYEALIAVQKMMTHNWEFLGKKTRDLMKQ